MGRWWWTAALLVGWSCTFSDGGGDDDEGTDAGDDDDDNGGDDDDDDTISEPLECEDTFTPCGGDPVGSWTVTGFCSVPFEIPGVDCDELEVTITADRSDGTVEIAADHTYDRTYNIDLDAEIVIPRDCVYNLPCAIVEAGSQGYLTGCVEAATTCTCDATVAEVDSAAGTWQMDGTDFVADGADRYAMCVTGNQAVAEDENGVRVNWQK